MRFELEGHRKIGLIPVGTAVGFYKATIPSIAPIEFGDVVSFVFELDPGKFPPLAQNSFHHTVRLGELRGTPRGYICIGQVTREQQIVGLR